MRPRHWLLIAESAGLALLVGVLMVLVQPRAGAAAAHPHRHCQSTVITEPAYTDHASECEWRRGAATVIQRTDVFTPRQPRKA